MNKSTIDFIASPPENASPAQAQLQADAFNSFMAVPVTKLDADQYLVSDLDGVTEGLFGSGNMNFLMMQAGQTNESITTLSPFEILGGDDGTERTAPILSANPFASSSSTSAEALPIRFPGDLADTALQNLGASGNNNTSTNIGNLAASNLAANSQSSTPFSSIQNFSSANDTSTVNTFPPETSGTNGTDGTSGTNGQNGGSGNNGQDGTGVGDIINNVVNNYSDFLTETVENVNNAVTNVTNNTSDFLSTVVNTINNGEPLGPIGVDLGAAFDSLTNVTLDIISGDQTLNIVDEAADLSPALSPVNDLIGSLTAGTDLTAILNPFQYDNSPDDQDLSLITEQSALDLPLLDNLHISLDPVEGLLGDLDINFDTGAEFLGSLLGGDTDDTDLGLGLGSVGEEMPLLNSTENILLNPVEDLLGDIDINMVPNLDLFDTSAIDNTAGDTDVIVPFNLALIDSPLLSDAVNVDLGIIEQITGDIDLDLMTSGNVLGDTANGLIDNLSGGADAPNSLSDIGGGLSDITGNVLPSADGDTDFSLITNTDILDTHLMDDGASLVLDPAEDLVGDIDLGILPQLDLLGTSAGGPDTMDLSVPLDVTLLGTASPDQPIDINLDVIETITGDIDLAIPVSTDLLADPGSLITDATEIFEVTPDIGATSFNLADSIVQDIDGTLTGALDILSAMPDDPAPLNTDILDITRDTGDIGNWTESLLPDSDNLFGGGIVTDAADSLANVLPMAPIEAITSPTIISDTLGGLGGLGGGRHFGGLFG